MKLHVSSSDVPLSLGRSGQILMTRLVNLRLFSIGSVEGLGGGAKIVIWTKHTTVVNQKQLLASVFLGKSWMKSQNQECFENIVFMGQGAGNPPKLCLIFLLTKTDYFPVQLHHSCKFLL